LNIKDLLGRCLRVLPARGGRPAAARSDHILGDPLAVNLSTHAGGEIAFWQNKR
jgi:hypothetical protein